MVAGAALSWPDRRTRIGAKNRAAAVRTIFLLSHAFLSFEYRRNERSRKMVAPRHPVAPASRLHDPRPPAVSLRPGLLNPSPPQFRRGSSRWTLREPVSGEGVGRLGCPSCLHRALFLIAQLPPVSACSVLS